MMLGTSSGGLHEAISSGSPLDKTLQNIAGERHITDFVRSEVSQLRLGERNSSIETLPFHLVFDDERAIGVAEDLVQGIESLPWKYSFYTELPGEFSTEALGPQGELSLTPTLELITGAKLNRKLPAKHSLLASFAGTNQAPWADKSIYIRLSLEGYVSSDRQSETVHDATDYLFSLYGLALANDILESDSGWVNVRPATSYRLAIFRIGDDDLSHLSDVELDPSHAKEIRNLGSPRSLMRTSEEFDTLFQERFHEIGRVLMNVDRRVLNAARWYFDSHCGSNDQVRFVQIATAFEILLGDQKQGRETGLSTLMANRCAYMLGRNEIQRTRIRTAFMDGYDIRSRIVHTGKTRLSHAERAQFRVMQSLCASVICKECSEFMAP